MRLTAALFLSLLASPALADAVTYTGTIGKTPIVVEFTAPPKGAKAPFAGRYFYVSKGIDIPLEATRVGGRDFALTEEKPCTVDTCVTRDDGIVAKPPLGAKWQLALDRDGTTLTGKWTEAGRSQPVTLTLAGSRVLPDDSEISPMGLAAISEAFIYDDQQIAEDTAPYDYLRMQVPQQESAVTGWSGSSFRYLSDPRTKFPYPTVVALAGNADATAANSHLQARHWQLNSDAFRCQSLQYAGLGWEEVLADAVGTLGGYEDEEVEVTALTPTVMSWTESGSLFCGGAHPYNHHSFYNLDVKTGQPLDLSRIFSGWLPKSYDDTPVDLDDARTHPQDFIWGPDAELAAFVKAHRISDAELGLDANPNECGIDDLVDSNLAISFKTGDRVLFALDGLPNAIVACGGDLHEAPIAELKKLLAPEAAKYFPSLDD
ncbi:MAG: hypothetical protein Q7T08_04795 [Devosia sp.]|nr:hypothetical protein [Devosia sp.]